MAKARDSQNLDSQAQDSQPSPTQQSQAAKSQAAKPYFVLKGLRISLGDREILRGVDLRVERGETLVLLGSSGGGKSVLLMHLATLMKPDAGEVWVDDHEVSKLNERQLEPARVKLGMMFQHGALFDSLNVAENVAFPLMERGGIRRRQRLKGAALQEVVMKALAQVNMEEHAQKMPSELSGGMIKRVALARTLIDEPEAILYDEPTAGLDPIATNTIDELIGQTQRRLGVTSVVITHDLRSCWRIANRIAFLHQGKIHWIGGVKQFQQTQDAIVRDYLDAHAM